METQTKKQTKTFNVLGYKIEGNSCSALTYRVYLKDFDQWVSKSSLGGLVMNHIKIHEFLDKAICTEVKQGDDFNYLVIETELYQITFEVPKVKEGEF